MKGKLVKETPVTLTEVKDLLKKTKEKEELSFRAQKTWDHLEGVSLLPAKKAKELRTKLEKLNVPRLREQHTAKLIDTLPKTPNDVKLVLQSYAIAITNENLKKIADTITEFTK